MQIAANAASIARARGHEEAAYHFAGLLIVALFPALFWTAMVASVGAVIGYSLSPLALMVFGSAVAAFCATVGQMLFSRR
jgi:hypothetical protein